MEDKDYEDINVFAEEIESETAGKMPPPEEVIDTEGYEKQEIVPYKPVLEKQESEEKKEEKEPEAEKDTSFNKYVKSSKSEQRPFLIKWGIRLAKVILFLMILPVIALIGGGIIAIIGGYSMMTIFSFGGGVFALCATAFMSSQLTPTIIAMGIAAGITAMSGAGILAILFIMLFKWILKTIKQIRNKRKEGAR